MYGFGDNNESQLGLKENNLYEFPQKIDGIRETIGAVANFNNIYLNMDSRLVVGKNIH